MREMNASMHGFGAATAVALGAVSNRRSNGTRARTATPRSC